MQINGINVTSLVAGLGILSAIVGLALQDVIKDIVTGLRIVSEHYFGVGDVIMYEDIEGEVIELSIRSTTIRNINNDEITTISNRLFSKATTSINFGKKMIIDIYIRCGVLFLLNCNIKLDYY